jgi:predicted nucleotidyltransferase
MGLLKLQNFLELKRICKEFIKENSNIVDIVIFGSVVRSKRKPGDVDICVLSLDKFKKLDKLKKVIGKEFKKDVHVSILYLRDFLNPEETLWKTIFHEGISLTKDKLLSKLIGFDPSVLFWYKLENLKLIDKIKFSYALRGRNEKGGILREVNGEYLGKGCIMVPVENEDEIREFFARWNIPFNRRRILTEF